jgi:hypothetical protein
MPPSPKNLSKNGFCPLKGGSLCVKDVFAEKFLVRESISLVAPASAAVTRLAA